MLTVDQTITFLEEVIAGSFLAGDRIRLQHVQTTAGVMMQAAESIKDSSAAQRFRFVAAQAANRIEELDNTND